jgi:hypothetical protein
MGSAEEGEEESEPSEAKNDWTRGKDWPGRLRSRNGTTSGMILRIVHAFLKKPVLLDVTVSRWDYQVEVRSSVSIMGLITNTTIVRPPR